MKRTPKLIFDTRFFVEYFYSSEIETQTRARELVRKSRYRCISAITLHELYRISLAREGKDMAKLRRQAVEDLFTIQNVDSETAVKAAELRHLHPMPMADGIIAATCILQREPCATDDPHLTSLKKIKTMWI